jgi:hypothetical protein
MLGTYLYQLFFVGLSGNNLNEPTAVSSLCWQLRSNPELLPDLRETLQHTLHRKIRLSSTSDQQLAELFLQRLAALYMFSRVQLVRAPFTTPGGSPASASRSTAADT